MDEEDANGLEAWYAVAGGGRAEQQVATVTTSPTAVAVITTTAHAQGRTEAVRANVCVQAQRTG